MLANNETGVLQPVEQIGKIAADTGVFFHIDAVQGAGKVPIDVRKIGCHLLSISAHKMHGPKGVGAMFVRRGTPVESLLVVGSHERRRRAGTENVAGIVGLAKAAELAMNSLEDGTIERVAALRDRLEAELLRLPGTDNSVIGLTLHLWDQTRLAGKHGIPDAPKAGRCCSLDDVYDARRVAEHLGIPYYVVNQEERFEQDVVRPFVSEYLAGRTPIPCSLCNNHLKFDQLLKTARSIGADRIATGHYAINEFDPERGRWILKRPADLAKDQTYFLFGLTQEQLSRTLFPLGNLTKTQVREA